MNPNNAKQMSRLVSAMGRSRMDLQCFRQNRLDAIKQYVGKHYSEQGASDRVPFNLLELSVNIYARQLAASAPRTLITTPHKVLKPMAKTLSLACDHLSEEIELGKTFRLAVLDALFSFAVVKCGMAKSAEVEIDGFTHDVGQPFADRVSLDDWVHDMRATRWDKIEFAGDRYRLPLEFVKNYDLFDAKAVRNLTASEPSGQNEAEAGSDERTETLSKQSQSLDDEYQEHIDLWDVWLPQENLIVTLPVGSETPVAVQSWDGPEKGPYHLLGFADVPDNTMPLAPVALWMDMHDLANRIFRKLGRGAERRKTILGVQGAAEADGKRIIDADDGQAIRLDHADGAREYTFGGVDPATLAFLLQLKDVYSYFAGNLDTLGGLSPQAETLGQERLLSASASKRMADMQDRTIGFAKGVVKDLAYYLWTDPLIEIPVVKRVPKTDIEIHTTFTPEMREGDFLDYNFDIQPYSMQTQSPGERVQSLMQILSQLIVPFIPMLEAQGIAVDFAALFRLLSDYTNMPEIEDILIFASAPPEPGPVQPDRGRMPPQTTRRYERVNRPGATRSGKDEALTQLLLGSKLQQSQAAGIARPIN